MGGGIRATIRIYGMVCVVRLYDEGDGSGGGRGREYGMNLQLI